MKRSDSNHLSQIKPIFAIIFALIAWGCGESPGQLAGSTTTATVALGAGSYEPAARFIFKEQNFSNLIAYVTSPHTSYSCLGDVTKAFYVTGPDYSGAAPMPSPFPLASVADDFTPTNRPAFIKNVSTDMTNTYFALTQANAFQSDQCSYRGIASDPGPSSCADFDDQPPPSPAPTIAPTPTITPSPTPTATPTTAQYYQSQFYRVRDDWCSEQGPLKGPDPEQTKSYVGGVSIDLDRTYLGANEDLLMNITYHAYGTVSAAVPLTPSANWMGNQLTNDHTVLEVDLIGTASALTTLMGVKQPRSNTYYSSPSYPIYIKKIATFDDPYGSLRTEQVYLPISQNPLVDRVRIERIRGSYHLMQIDIYRLGNRAATQ